MHGRKNNNNNVQDFLTHLVTVYSLRLKMFMHFILCFSLFGNNNKEMVVANKFLYRANQQCYVFVTFPHKEGYHGVWLKLKGYAASIDNLELWCYIYQAGTRWLHIGKRENQLAVLEYHRLIVMTLNIIFTFSLYTDFFSGISLFFFILYRFLKESGRQKRERESER